MEETDTKSIIQEDVEDFVWKPLKETKKIGFR
jgi:hypothetical protein